LIWLLHPSTDDLVLFALVVDRRFVDLTQIIPCLIYDEYLSGQQKIVACLFQRPGFGRKEFCWQAFILSSFWRTCGGCSSLLSI
jgi:hypothetical protein